MKANNCATLIKVLVTLAVMWVSMPSHAVRTMVWDKTVIPLRLVVGVEQMLHFEGSVSPGLTELLNDQDIFRAMSTNGTVYLTALRPFDTQRVKFKLKDGDYILVDLSADMRKSPPKTMEPIKILADKGSDDESHQAVSRHDTNKQKAPVSMFDVLRYGAQVMVSPKRVIKPVQGITTVSLKITGDLKRLYQANEGESLSILAVRGWSAGGVYVTALKVSNTGASPIAFDLSRLQHTHKTIVNGVNNQFVASAMLDEARVLKATTSGSGRRGSAFVLVATEHPFASVLDL